MANKIISNPLVKYLLEAKEELKKVSWPSQKETIRYSLVVIVFCVALAVYFGSLDWILNLAIAWLVGLTA
ncbi:preprotein translocase subunit SecE [Patescibacteria group bacterium]|nr:preprotein translocase subunit SecE [Patescibacteria group bacterium]